VSRTIAVIGGTGPAGTGLALRWARAGENVIIGSRDAVRAQQTADAIRQRVGMNTQISGMENSAVPFPGGKRAATAGIWKIGRRGPSSTAQGEA